MHDGHELRGAHRHEALHEVAHVVERLVPWQVAQVLRPRLFGARIALRLLGRPDRDEHLGDLVLGQRGRKLLGRVPDEHLVGIPVRDMQRVVPGDLTEPRVAPALRRRVREQVREHRAWLLGGLARLTGLAALQQERGRVDRRLDAVPFDPLVDPAADVPGGRHDDAAAVGAEVPVA